MTRELMIDSRFAAAGGLVNLLTNPSMETGTANGVTARTNLCLTPRAINSGGTLAGGWAYSASDEVGTSTLVTGAADGPVLPDGTKITTYARRSVTTAKTTGSTGWQIGGVSALPVTIAAGDIYTCSLWVRSSAAVTTNFRLQARNGATLIGNTDLGNTALQAGVWTQLSVSIASASVITGAGDNIQVWAYQATGVTQPAGSTFDVTGLIVEKAHMPRPYFDGAMAATDPDLTPAWSGTANASTSLMRGTQVTSMLSSGAVNVRSSQWAAAGTYSDRVIAIPAGTGAINSTTNIYIGGNSSTAMNCGMVAGKSYTIRLRIRLAAPLAGALHGSSRKVGVQYNNVSGTVGATTEVGAAAPNTAGEHDIFHTFSLPADAVWARLIFYNGASLNNGDVWVDKAILSESSYTGPYFDGSMGNAKWTGSAHASTSLSNGWAGY